MRSVTEEESETTEGRASRLIRRYWPLAAFLIAALVIGVWAAVSPAAHPTAGHEVTASQTVKRSTSSKKPVKKDGDQSARFSAKKQWKKTAVQVVRTTLSWSKKDGTDHSVAVSSLTKAGMSEQAAKDYKPMWQSVFGPAVSADLHGSSARLGVVDGPIEGDSISYVVTAGLSPSWTDRKGRSVRVPAGSAEWTVTIDRNTGRATSIEEPDPQWLWFALPEDGLKPSEGEE